MFNYDSELSPMRINPIQQAWYWLGETIWKRRVRGSHKKRAIAAEAQVSLLQAQLRNNLHRSFESGWRAGWAEALDIAGIKFTGFQYPQEPSEETSEE